MKRCVCGEDNLDDAAECAACGRAFDEDAQVVSMTQLPSWAPARPDGLLMVTLAYVLGIAAIVAMVIGFNLRGDYDYLTNSLTPNPWRLPVIALSIAALNLAFILWSVGKIVNALWYLPGRE